MLGHSHERDGLALLALVALVLATPDLQFLSDLYTASTDLQSSWSSPAAFTVPCQAPLPGITCNAGNTAIINISMGDQSLYCDLPSSFWTLTMLQYISFTDNDLTATLPATFPAAWSSLLTFLQINDNHIHGSIPPLNLPNLVVLDLNSNELSGVIPSFNTLTKLQYLDLTSNALTGQIPNFTAFSKVTYLDLTGNDFVSTIPSLNALSQLTQLDLSGLSINGTLPSLAKLTSMIYLRLEDNYISGTIDTFKALTQMDYLYLYSNSISGTIPSSLAMVNCTYFWLEDNLFTGLNLSIAANILANDECDLNYNCFKNWSLVPSQCASSPTPSSACATPCPGNGNCNGHGYCYTDGTCECDYGYANPTGGCSVMCPLRCSDSGTCNNNGTCTCDYGYTGAGCNITQSVTCPGNGNCNNHGTCDSYTGVCTCDSGYTGTDCGTAVPVEVAFLCDWYNQFDNGWTSPCSWTSPCQAVLEGITCASSHITKVGPFTDALDGTLPVSLANLAALTIFNITSIDWLYGTLPSLSAMTMLAAFSTPGSDLSGTIPSLLMNTGLRYLNLGSAYISGTIPPLAQCTLLMGLDLDNNNLVGAIPAISTLNLLQYLDLSYNYLAGTFPATPASLTKPMCNVNDNCFACTGITTCMCNETLSGTGNCNATCVGGCFHGTCYGGYCACDSGYTGTYCNTTVVTCPGNGNCNLNGVCNSDGTCTCYYGWTGSDCGTQSSAASFIAPAVLLLAAVLALLF
jgi:Leucine-rich repeat (LRR) protein